MTNRNRTPTIYKINGNWITSVHHQTWLQKANPAASPWMLMLLSAPPGQHHTSSWIVFVAVARQHQVSDSMDEPHQPAQTPAAVHVAYSGKKSQLKT